MSPARRLASLGLLALFGLQWLWHGWWAPPAHLPALGVAALFALPLLPAMALHWRSRRHADFWAAVTALFYFCHGVMETWSSPAARGPALVETAVAVVLIVAASWDGMQARIGARRR